jgi:predicted metal-dependent hydrolase
MSDKAAAALASFEGDEIDAHYLAYFELFDQHCFFEAHEVLEQLWLPARTQPEGAFYKALIQLAGGFVHAQKSRLGPARALFKLSLANLGSYPEIYQGFAVGSLRRLLAQWLLRLEPIRPALPGDFSPADAPKLAGLLEKN